MSTLKQRTEDACATLAKLICNPPHAGMSNESPLEAKARWQEEIRQALMALAQNLVLAGASVAIETLQPSPDPAQNGTNPVRGVERST